MLTMSTDQAQEILMDRSKVISHDRLMQVAPSIFSTAPSRVTSAQYHFIPTDAVLDIMKTQGWLPVYANEQTVRAEGRAGFQRHILRFRNFEKNFILNGSAVEMVLMNSHDGKCSYQIHTGVFRLVCMNGMVVGDSLFDRLKVRHQGNFNQDFINVSHEVMQNVPKVAQAIQDFGNVTLNQREKEALATAAIQLRWPQESPAHNAPIRPEQLLYTRRMADDKNDLYTVFNCLQENLIRGGLRARTRTNRPTRTREITGIQENVKLNKALWTLAEEMKRIKETR